MKKSFFIITNNSLFINQHLIPLIKKLKEKYDLYLLTSEVEKLDISFENIKILDINIRRKPSIKNEDQSTTIDQEDSNLERLNEQSIKFKIFIAFE